MKTEILFTNEASENFLKAIASLDPESKKSIKLLKVENSKNKKYPQLITIKCSGYALFRIGQITMINYF